MRSLICVAILAVLIICPFGVSASEQGFFYDGNDPPGTIGGVTWS